MAFLAERKSLAALKFFNNQKVRLKFLTNSQTISTHYCRVLHGLVFKVKPISTTQSKLG